MKDLFFVVKDGAASLTTAGYIAAAVLAAAALILIGFLGRKEKKFTVRQLAFSAMAIALGFLLSYVKIVHLPWGGSATLLSMLMIVLVGYWYGPAIGFSASFAYGLLQFVQGGGSYMLSFWQVGFDYLFAFTALGASGFFRGKKHGLQIGYCVAVLLRGLFHTVGGYLYWMDYMPDNFPKSLAFAYPVVYNYAYILIEAAITLIVISLPPMQRGLQEIGKMVRTER